jgi:hypothetical protein
VNIYSGNGSDDPYAGAPLLLAEEDTPAASAPDRVPLIRRLLSLSDLAALPPVVPLVDGLLYRSTLAQLAGPPGSYKSFLALALACCVALGEDFDDHKVPTAGVVVYVAAEGASGLRARVLAWCELAGVDPARLEGRLYFLTEPVQLGSVVDVTEAVELVRELGASLLVLDTRARCTLGLDENSATEQGKAVHAAEAIQRAVSGCTVLAVHHTSRAGTAGRGSNAWDGAAWTDLRISGEELTAKLHCQKHKDVPAGCDHHLRLVRHVVSPDAMAGCDEAQRSTLVIVRTDPADASPETKPSTRAVLDVIRTTAGPEGLTTATIRDLAMEAGHSRTIAYEAVNALVRMGSLRNVGTSKTPRWQPMSTRSTSGGIS